MSSFNKYRLKGAYHYDWYETEDWYRWLVDRCVKFCKGDTIDIGGGDGVVAKKIQENGYSVIVADNDPDALSLAQEKGIPTEFVDLENTIWMTPDIQPDYLCSINVIEHLKNPSGYLNAIKNNVRKGAIITTIDYQGGALGEDHKFEWTLDQLVDFFKEFNPKPFRYKDTEWIGVEILK